MAVLGRGARIVMALLHLRTRSGGTDRVLPGKSTSARSGQSVTIAWETTGATALAIEWRPLMHREEVKRSTGLPTKGSMEDHPKENTIYVLECESQLGSVCASASTTVLVK